MSERWTNIADSVRTRTRRLVLMRGAAWVCAVVVGLLWLAGLADWSLHLDSSIARLAILVGVVAATFLVLWRAVIRPLLVRLSDVDIARLLEQRFAKPRDGLSSAAQFRLAREDPSLGSPELQRTTIAAADRTLEGIDIGRLFSSVSSRRALAAALITAGVALTSLIAAPASAKTAMLRLAMPFSDISWPRTTRLRLLDARLSKLEDQPLRTTAGEPLSMYVENELGPLPDDLTLDLHLPDDVEQQQTLRTTLLRDTNGKAHEVGIVTLMAHRGPLRFRVWGGDDEGTAWRTVDVVPAPSLQNLSITVTPPAYTGQSARTLPGAGLIEGLVGSRVAITGEASESLSKAVLHLEGQTPRPMPLSDGGRQFRIEFTIERPGQSWYWFELLDEHGLTEPEPPRYELRGIADQPPVVYIDAPATDLTVTPNAEIPLRVVARDDWGLTELRLRHTDAGVADTPDATSETPEAASMPITLSGQRPPEETAETDWRLGPLSLSPGDQLTYWAEAVDACDPDPDAGDASGQVGASARRRLNVISPSDKQRELAARQSGMLDTLEALRDRQAQAREITAQLRIQAELAGELRPHDIDLLKQAELEQRDIRRQISDETSGLSATITSILQELDTNQIDDPEAARRMAMLATDLGELDGDLLPMIEQALARTRKSAGDAGDDTESADANEIDSRDEPPSTIAAGKDAQRQLQDAEDAQTTALTIFSDAATLLGGWRQRFHISSELDEMVADQKLVQEETKTIGRETATIAASRLTAQQQADLARLSDRQRRLATRLEQLTKPPSADRMGDENSGSESDRALEAESEELREARSWLRKQGAAGDMHQAAESLKRNEIPAAARAQENVLEMLRRFGERLHETPLSDPESLLSGLQESREQVETLRKQQESLTESSQLALAPTADPAREEQLQRLLKRQSELADDTAEMARQLKRQQRSEAARTADRAANRMDDARNALEKQEPEEVAENQQEALDDLEQLDNELAALQQDIEGQIAEQKLDQLADELGLIADEQRSVRETTTDLNGRQPENGSWSRSLRRELQELIGRQRQLHTQVDEQRADLDEFLVVEAALAAIGESMDRAGDRLDEQETGAATLALQQEAEQRLASMIEVLAEGRNGEPAATDSQPSGGRRTPSQSAPDPQVAIQLKLLRRMQADVKRRTEELAASAEVQEGSANEQTRQQISQEQGRIAQLAKSLLQQYVETQTFGGGDDGGGDREITP